MARAEKQVPQAARRESSLPQSVEGEVRVPSSLAQETTTPRNTQNNYCSLALFASPHSKVANMAIITKFQKTVYTLQTFKRYCNVTEDVLEDEDTKYGTTQLRQRIVIM